MSRTLSSNAVAGLNAAATDQVYLILLTISHTKLAAPLRVTSDAVNTASRGNTFVPYPFDLRLPDDREDRAPRARLAIDNVDRVIVGAVGTLASAPSVLIEIVLAATPDTVEAAFPDFRLENIRYDAQVVEGDLVIEDFTTEPYPSKQFTPGLFPGLF